MIIYFADRTLNITGQASTNLPGGIRILEDNLLEEIESGVNAFSFKINFDDENRADVETAIKVGNFVLKSGGDAFSSEANTYDSVYQIIETELDTLEKELYVYAEDAGLDLINKVVEGTTLENKNLLQMLQAFVPTDWTINLINTPTNTKTYTWDGDNTATERINSIVGIFDCEVYYSFVVERFEIKKKVINVTRKRGQQIATAQLRLGYDLNKIVTKESIADLATAFVVTGGTPEGTDTPINLKGYSYSYTDPETGDVYAVDAATGQMRNKSAMSRWSSALDPDGLIMKRFEFDTTDKAELAGQARAELQKQSKKSVEYEVDLSKLPEGIRVGDRVNIIDRAGNLYFEARILKIETSVSDDSQKATIGDYVAKSPGISEKVRDLAKRIQEERAAATPVLQILSSEGEALMNANTRCIMAVSIAHRANVISNITQLHAAFGNSARLTWYKNGQLTTAGVSQDGFRMTIDNVESLKTTFRCQLEVD